MVRGVRLASAAVALPDELRGRWNHNTHYYRLALDAMPRPCRAALDVGCGDGLLLRMLAAHCDRVVGIDPAREVLDTARGMTADLSNVTLLADDVLAHPFAPQTFDLVTSYAAIHHVPFPLAIKRLAALLRPGGVLVVVGLARNRTPADSLFSALGVPVHRLLALRHGYWQHSAPIAIPQMTWAEAHQAAREILPDMRWRRHLLWRYSLTWTKPTAG
jgi:SAM-dependent methyltransferase